MFFIEKKCSTALCIYRSINSFQCLVIFTVTDDTCKTKLPDGPGVVTVDTSEMPSFTRGVEGITRKKESIFRVLLSLLRSGTESDLDICRCANFVCKKQSHK